MLNEMGFTRQFDGMLASYELGAVKPTIEFFVAAYDRLHHPAGDTPGVNAGNHTPGVKEAGPYLIPKSQILFWDNDEENVAGARAADIPAKLYEGVEQFKQVIKRSQGS